METNKKVLGGVAAVIALGLVGATFMGMMPGGPGPGQEEQTTQKTVVETVSPAYGTIARSGSFVGTVEPGQQVSVYPKASGEVIAANFTVGDTVEAGQVLFSLDATSLQLDVAQKQAQLSSSQAVAELKLEQAQNDLDNYNGNIEGGLNATLVNAENAVKNAEAALQLANANLRAARTDFNDAKDEGADDATLTSLRNVRVQRELAVEQAQLTLEQAEAALELAKNQVQESGQNSEYSLRSAELGADFTADYIALQKLQKSVNDYTVTAPISGVVEQKNIDVYDMASTQSVAYVISNKDSVSITFSVAETALDYIRPGNVVTVEKDGNTTQGVITEVSTMTNAQSGLYTVKATVENASFDLRSGSTVKVWADTQKVENEIIIPIDAVYYDNGTPYVFLFENNAARKVQIETGISDEASIHVKSGLSTSDNLIVTWSSSLYDGAEVYLPGTVPTDDAAAGQEETEAPDADAATGSELPQDEQQPGPLQDGESGRDNEGGDEPGGNNLEEEAA